MARVTQLGYVGLGVSDVAAWEPFTTEVLGLQLGERLPDGTLLLRMDDNHYRIAVHPGGDDDLAYYLCQDKGVPISVSLGRHTNDLMLSFYLTTPSGIDIEYGCGGRVVDDATWQVIYHEKGTLWGHKRVGPSVATAQPAAATGG